MLTSYAKARAEAWLPDFTGGWLERAERVVLLIAGAALGAMKPALVLVAVGSVATAVQRIIIARRRLETEEARP